MMGRQDKCGVSPWEEVAEMTVQPEQDHVTTSQCWCCGNTYGEENLIRLGQHPEVGVCLTCARWLQRRAVQRHDEQHPSWQAELRSRVDSIRNAVIRRGWHRQGAFGKFLRWINRYLP
jgi:hypothetical protein